jgi:hypothetical protein
LGKYNFCEGQLASDLKPAFERFLFNEERHLRSQSLTDWNTFSLVDLSAKLIIAQIHIHLDNRLASSPYKAPFGSIEFNETLSAESLFYFMSKVEEELRKKNIAKLVIKDAPQIYRPNQSPVLSVVLTDLGFKITKLEINSSISVDEMLWIEKISDSEQRRLRKCENEKLVFKQIQLSQLKLVYDFISECRKERGNLLSMTYESLESTVKMCESDFFLFGVFQEDEMIAACICVRVTKSIIYNFYPAHRKSADQLSPLVFLLDNLYKYCQVNGFRMIDLGTSALPSGINFSLLNFKTEVGGKPSMKLTFEKEWN